MQGPRMLPSGSQDMHVCSLKFDGELFLQEAFFQQLMQILADSLEALPPRGCLRNPEAEGRGCGARVFVTT